VKLKILVKISHKKDQFFTFISYRNDQITTRKQANSDRQIAAVAIELPPLLYFSTVIAAFLQPPPMFVHPRRFNVYRWRFPFIP
jgi:hypothetical protein